MIAECLIAFSKILQHVSLCIHLWHSIKKPLAAKGFVATHQQMTNNPVARRGLVGKMFALL